MPRVDPLPRESVRDLEPILAASESRMGFLPNSQLIMARRPEVLRAFAAFAGAIMGPGSRVDPQLRNLVTQMASRAAGCGYCMAHTAHTGERVGLPPEKEEALWHYETSLLFSAAERAALRVARGAAQVPNAVADEDFAGLEKHYSDEELVDIVAAIALFGFLNRFNDTMATQLEASPARGRQTLPRLSRLVGGQTRALSAFRPRALPLPFSGATSCRRRGAPLARAFGKR